MSRGLDAETAAKVAEQLMARDALGAHAHDELGISQMTAARPIQAALTSAATFTAGAAAPLLIASLAPLSRITPLVSIGSLIFLAVLGAVGAAAGGAPVLKGALRVTFWGAFAMAATAGIGALVGANV
jgi:hypothetical protein